VRTYWYTTPRFFVLEWLATHAVLLPVIFWLAAAPWRVDVPRARGATMPPGVVRYALDAAEALLQAAAVITAVAIVAYKLPTGRAAYLAQPCHLQNFLLVGLMAASGCGLRGLGSSGGGGAKAAQHDRHHRHEGDRRSRVFHL
jgi:hypothetical protein